VLLQHVKVLAGRSTRQRVQESPTLAKAVTLEVDTDQAQKIILATNVGKLSVILRQADESNPVPVELLSLWLSHWRSSLPYRAVTNPPRACVVSW
jgi:pilus assembly protein CpaB